MRCVFFFLLVIGSISSTAQIKTEATGLFMTQEDLVDNRITELSPTDSLNNLERFVGERITLTRNGIVKEFPFGSIAGFYKNGFVYRAYRRKKFISHFGYFKVVHSNEEVIIYSCPGIYKTADKMFYYYSCTLTDTIKSLSSKKLKQFTFQIRDLTLNP
jgi:hypothetical protein